MEEGNIGFRITNSQYKLLLQPFSPLIVLPESSLRGKEQSSVMQKAMQDEGFRARQVYYYNANEGAVDEMECASVNGGKSIEISSSSSILESSIGIVKGQWTAAEDIMLIRLVKQHGVRKWSQIAKKFFGRIGKQCRERWHNHLRPGIKKDRWSEEEEDMLVEAHKAIGNRWAEIAKRIPGRTENSIKNHWNATKRKQNSKRRLRRKTIHGDASTPKLTALQEYIKSQTLCFPADQTKPTTTTHSSASNEVQMKLPLQPPQPDHDSQLACQMVEEMLYMEKTDMMRGFEEEDGDLLGCSDMEYVSQFLNAEEESLPSPISNVTCAGFEDGSEGGRGGGGGGGERDQLQWDFYLSNLLSGPSLPAIDEFGGSNVDAVTVVDGQTSAIKSRDMDLTEIFNWHLSHLQRYN